MGGLRHYRKASDQFNEQPLGGGEPMVDNTANDYYEEEKTEEEEE